MGDSEITVSELADLLLETGRHHHRAYTASDGTDPEWALWYSGYLQAKLWERAGDLPTRSLLVHLLLTAEEDFTTTGAEGDWSRFYAQLILDKLNSNT